MKIVITGTSGFIGRSLALHFNKDKNEVICISTADNTLADNCKMIKSHQMRLPSSLISELLAEEKPAVLIHAAGKSSVPQSLINPADDYTSGPPVVFQLLESLRLCSPKTIFLFLSSAAVYGNPTELPIREDQAINPISPYGYHKYQSELIVQEFAAFYGIRAASIRIFSAYGNQLKRQVMWDICQKASKHNEIPLMGSGCEERDFIHVIDICRALELICHESDIHGQAINLCSGIATPIKDIALLLASNFPNQPSINFTGDQLPGAPIRWQGDNSWLRSRGFEYAIPLADGVKGYVEWFQQTSCR